MYRFVGSIQARNQTALNQILLRICKMCAESEYVHPLDTSMDFHCHGVNFILIRRFHFLNFILRKWVFTLWCMACEETKIMGKKKHFVEKKIIKQHVTKTLYTTLLHTHTHTHIYIYVYTECHRRNGPNFGRVFLMLNYTDITQNTYIQC